MIAELNTELNNVRDESNSWKEEKPREILRKASYRSWLDFGTGSFDYRRKKNRALQHGDDNVIITEDQLPQHNEDHHHTWFRI